MLSLRFLRSWYRCPVNLAIQGAQYIFFALLIGEGHPAVSGWCGLHVHGSLCSTRLGRLPHIVSAAWPWALPCLQILRRLCRGCDQDTIGILHSPYKRRVPETLRRNRHPRGHRPMPDVLCRCHLLATGIGFSRGVLRPPGLAVVRGLLHGAAARQQCMHHHVSTHLVGCSLSPSPELQGTNYS